MIHCETPFSVIIFRTQLLNAADIANVQKVQSGYSVQTLSGFLKQPGGLRPKSIPAEWIHGSTGIPSRRLSNVVRIGNFPARNKQKLLAKDK